MCNVGVVLKTSVTRRERRVHTVWKKRKIAGEFAALLYYLIEDGLEFKECYRMSEESPLPMFVTLSQR